MRRAGWLSVLAGILGCTGCPAPERTGEGSPEPTGTPGAAAQPAPSAPASPRGAEEGGPLEIKRSYAGRIFVAPPEMGGSPPTRVVRSLEELRSFAGSIPDEQIQKRQPAPPSDDPLLGDPGIDWSREMLVLAIRSDSMYVKPEIVRVERRGEGAHVVYRLPPLGDSAMASAMLNVGTYGGAVIERVSGEVSFECLPREPEPGPR